MKTVKYFFTLATIQFQMYVSLNQKIWHQINLISSFLFFLIGQLFNMSLFY